MFNATISTENKLEFLNDLIHCTRHTMHHVHCTYPDMGPVNRRLFAKKETVSHFDLILHTY